MFELLLKSINEKVQLTGEEEKLFTGFFMPRKLKKKQYLLQQGDVCKYLAFVDKGILRSYATDEKEHEHVIQFAFEGYWIADQLSFLTGEPSTNNIDALEDCELLLLSRENRLTMFEAVPKIERYFRILLENHLVILQRRVVSSLSYSAEEKYRQLLKTQANYIQKIPLHMIASYLGITPETLSRIRKNLATNNK